MQTTLFGNITEKDSARKEITYHAETYKGLYAMHKYWGKKPYNVMAEFIKKYSKPSEVVLDPFCGSGVSISEAVFNSRKGIGIDINPSSILITRNVIQVIDSKKMLKEFNRIERTVKNEIDKLYSVERGGLIYEGQNFLWENGRLTEVRFSIGSRSRQTDKPGEKDILKANKISYDDIEVYFPKNRFLHNSRINANRKNRIYDLFTPRNLYALSLIFQEIEKIADQEMRGLFEFCFTASVGQASKMVFVIKRRNKTKGESAKISEKKEVGSWVIGYWMPSDFFENNAWTCFENRFKKIYKAKKAQEKTGQRFNLAKDFRSLIDSADYLLAKQPSQDYLKTLPDNSIDYILTDPPHGNRIPYLELSLLWNSWLKEESDFEKEIIVSESKDRNKDINDYNSLMHDVFKECFRLLKPNSKLSFMFNSLDDDAWIGTVGMFRNIGFHLEEIETLGYSANSVVQDNRKNGLQTDFIITFSKPEKHKPLKSIELIDITSQTEALNKVETLKRNGYKTFQIMNRIVKDTLSNDQFLSVTDLIKVIENA